MAEIGDVKSPQTIPLESYEEALANYNAWNGKMPVLPNMPNVALPQTAGSGTDAGAAQNEDEAGGG